MLPIKWRFLSHKNASGREFCPKEQLEQKNRIDLGAHYAGALTRENSSRCSLMICVLSLHMLYFNKKVDFKKCFPGRQGTRARLWLETKDQIFASLCMKRGREKSRAASQLLEAQLSDALGQDR